MQELTIKQKLTNYYYFIIFNSILACVIGVWYWLYGPVNYWIIPKLSDWITILYLVTTHFIVFTLLVAIVSLFILPTIYFKGKKTLILQSILASIFIGILIFDIGVFHADRIHLININIDQAISNLTNKDFMLRVNRIIAYIGFIAFVALIYQMNKWINKTSWFTNNKIGSKFAILLLVSIIISQMVYTTSSKKYKKQLSTYAQYLPINLNDANIIKQKIASNYKYINTGKLQYPLKPLQTTVATNPPNILIIAMDAWRADCFNEIDSPNLWEFAQNGVIFTKHNSAGNRTYSGLFGLFYGVPAIYFNRFKQQNISSVFFSRLKHLDYQINFFTADSCIEYFTNDTQNLHVINNKDIRLYLVDKQITDSWMHSYTNLNKTKPWFSFVFYDSLHGPDFPEHYSTIAKPSIGLLNYKEFANNVGKQGFINSYKTAVHYIDSLANKILTQLKEDNDLENTIVIITADHGCEWNDNDQGQWGYAINFTDCQVKVPLAIILPKQFQQQLINQQDNLTTHYDIVPTLMHNFLGVINNIADYSIGDDLLNDNKLQQEWSLATSFGQYSSRPVAVIGKNITLRISPSGTLDLIDNFNQLMFNQTINTKHLNQALEMITRFIKK